MKNQQFNPLVLMWMLLIFAFMPSIWAYHEFGNSFLAFSIVYAMVIGIGVNTMGHFFFKQVPQSEFIKRYIEKENQKTIDLEKQMMASGTENGSGVGGSHFKHRWVLKFLIRRNKNLLQKMINIQVNKYKTREKICQMIKEFPEKRDMLNKEMGKIDEKLKNVENQITEVRARYVCLKIDLIKYDSAKK